MRMHDGRNVPSYRKERQTSDMPCTMPVTSLSIATGFM